MHKIADDAKRLWTHLNALDIAHWSLLRQHAFLRSRQTSLLELDDTSLICVLQDLSRAALGVADDIRLDMGRGRNPSPEGVMFIEHLAKNWPCQGEISSEEKSYFYRAVRLVIEHTQIPITDPHRWIDNYKDLQNRSYNE